ncbi:MAG: CsbD family protein [Acidimicrobiales bacterium]
MATSDKAANKVQDLKGRAKEAAGRVAGDNGLESEGEKDQVVAAVKDVGVKVKDAGAKVKRSIDT